MSTIVLEAETRADMGKGASRRLRRLEGKVPAVLYGSGKAPKSIHLFHHKLIKALDIESIYSSVFDLNLDGKVERVILKDLQRHPYKPVILHLDLQRVSAKDVLVKMIPLHFINEESAKGVKEGGMVNHTMNQVEVRCEARYLPEYIEVDVAELGLGDVLHLSDLKLPKEVHFATDLAEHDHPVVSIHLSKVDAAAEEELEAAALELEASEDAEMTEEGEGSSDEAAAERDGETSSDKKQADDEA